MPGAPPSFTSPQERIFTFRSGSRPKPLQVQERLLQGRRTIVLAGLRMGEAAGLCWDAIEFVSDSQAKLRIIRTLSWYYKTKAPYFQDEAKTAPSIRTIAFEGFLLDVIRDCAKEVAPDNTGPIPIFRTNRGRLLRDNMIRENFNPEFRASKTERSGTHIARHTFATLTLMSESDLSAVQAALGHKSQRVTEGYAKVVALNSSRVSGGVVRLVGLGQKGL